MLSRNKKWEDAVFESLPSKPVSAKMLHRITGELAANDSRVVVESAELALTSRSAGTRERRRALAKERYAHLLSLKPYIDAEQLMACAAAGDAMKRLDNNLPEDDWDEEDWSDDTGSEDEDDYEDETDDEDPIPLTSKQLEKLRDLHAQPHTIQEQMKTLASEIEDVDVACAVSDAVSCIDDALDALREIKL